MFTSLLKATSFEIGSRLGSGRLHRFPARRNAVKNGDKRLAVRRGDTEITIDGLQRSSNTFFTDIFMRANPETRVAHHLHCSGQIKKSIALGIPTVVIIREPVSAACAIHVLWPYISLRRALRAYVRYYSALSPADSVIAFFDDITTKPDSVIDQINEQYGTQFHTSAQAGLGWDTFYDKKSSTYLSRKRLQEQARETILTHDYDKDRAKALTIWRSFEHIRPT